MEPSAFPSGIVVFFRALDRQDLLVRSVHPNGRNIRIKDTGYADYVIIDENEDVVGIYPREWVSAILPLQTTGPGDAANQPIRRDSAPSAEEGDSESILGRTKRFNS